MNRIPSGQDNLNRDFCDWYDGHDFSEGVPLGFHSLSTDSLISDLLIP